jgi:4-hydroxybutyrate CoA-transferase
VTPPQPNVTDDLGPGEDRAAQELGALVHDGDRLFVGTGAGEPHTLLRLLIDHVLPRRHDVEILQVSVGGSEIITGAPQGRGHRVRLVAGGRLGNEAIRAGRASLESASMGTLDELIASGRLRIDGVLVAGTRTSAEISPGLALDLGRSAAHAARFRALELNAALPPVRSIEWLRESDCQLVLPTDRRPPTNDPRPPTADQQAIGRHIAALIPVGAAVELGIGQGLQGVSAAICEDRPDLRFTIHTGMITDDVQRLVEHGIVSGPAPDADEASVVATVALGTAEFYRWLSDNPAVQFVDSSLAHRVAHLLSIGPFLAINSASQVDLLGNVVARDWRSSLAGGGLPDFATAGAHTAGSVIGLESRTRDGQSKIVAHAAQVQLHAGAVTHVVTEFGIAELQGASPLDRAQRIIAVAHPDDRPGLLRSLDNLGHT